MNITKKYKIKDIFNKIKKIEKKINTVNINNIENNNNNIFDIINNISYRANVIEQWFQYIKDNNLDNLIYDKFSHNVNCKKKDKENIAIMFEKLPKSTSIVIYEIINNIKIFN